MAYFLPYIAVLVLGILASVASEQLIAPRLNNGVPADTLRRFPHHVTIQQIYPGEWGMEAPPCGGSILNDQWILTSTYCADTCHQIELKFERLYAGNTVGSYSVLVNSDAVHVYPTNYDDIALIKLPFRLVFSDLIKPVTISSQPISQLEGKLAVLPGFDTDNALNGGTGTSPKDQLNYAMLSVISSDKCKQYYGSGWFDEYLQFCTSSYNNNPNTPCFTDYGGGLLTGWPARSELVGIYSSFSYNCGNRETPAIYTNVAKYVSWIKSVIEQ